MRHMIKITVWLLIIGVVIATSNLKGGLEAAFAQTPESSPQEELGDIEII